jgi:hypothetical protein
MVSFYRVGGIIFMDSFFGVKGKVLENTQTVKNPSTFLFSDLHLENLPPFQCPLGQVENHLHVNSWPLERKGIHPVHTKAPYKPTKKELANAVKQPRRYNHV